MTASIAQPQDSRRPWIVNRQIIGWSIPIVVAAIIALSGWVPWRVEYPNETLDTSWMLGLKWAHSHRVDFGNSFVFTYGPWGYVLQGYDPATFAAMIAVWSFFAAAFIFALVILYQNSALPKWAGAIWLLVVTIFFSTNITQDLRLLSLSWLLLLIHLNAKGRAAEICKAVLVVAMALAGLIKFTMTMMAVATIALITVQQIIEIFAAKTPGNKIWRVLHALRYAIIFVVAYLALWLMAGQRVSSLPMYIRHSMEISSSYARTQQLLSTDEFSSITFFLLCAIPLVAVIVIAHWRRWMIAGFAGASALLCLFLIFKEGFIRHDGHEMHATAGVLLLGILWSFLLWRNLPWFARSLSLAIIAGGIFLCWRTFLTFDSAGLPREIGRVFYQLPGNSHTALSCLTGHCDRQKSFDDEANALLKLSAGIPSVPSSADIYPWNSAMLIAHDEKNFRPRPVVQSYLAATPALSQLNVDFLRSPLAPDWIYFDFGTIDNRYPSMDDALSWPELLTRYNLRDLSPDSTIYERSEVARTFQIIPGEDQTAQLGDDIAVPVSDDFIWARIDVRESALGKLKEELYKATPLEMHVLTVNGTGEYFRFLPDVGRAGFLLSPRVRERNEFAMLTSGDWKSQLAEQMVTHIHIESTGKTGVRSSYQSEIHYAFDRLRFPKLDLSQVPGVHSYIGLRNLLHRSFVLDIHGPTGLARVDNHQMGLTVVGKSQLMVVPPSPPTSVHVGFGMLDASYLTEARTSGVMFLVFSMKPDGTAVPLWGRMLHPETTETDRGYQTADVVLPADTSRVVLETAPVVDAPANGCYWGEAEFK